MNKLYLIIIFILSFFIRIYSYNSIPLLWDEAALGYNAYSIVHTGKDEYGQFLPLIFKSFGDFKPGFYVYLTLPFVALFGLNPLTVRLPSILLGSILPIVLFFLVKLTTKNSQFAYLTSLLLCFNPINIHFSRGAWETNILTFELVLASFFAFKYFFSSKNIFLLLTSIVFGFSLYTYQAAKLISLLLIISLIISNFSKITLTNIKKYFLFFILPLLLFSIPILYGLLFSKDGNRLQVVSLLSYPRSETETQQIISESNQLDYSLFHSQPIFFVRNLLSRYFNNFSPKYLTFQGDWQNLRHSAPYVGILLFPSIIFFLIGIFNKNPKSHLFFYLWFIIAPIPAALTRDSITAVRAMSLSIPLIYFTSLGLDSFISKLPKLFIPLSIFIYSLSFLYYSDLYLNHLVKKDPMQFLYGYQQVMNFVNANQSKYQTINITNFYGQPYIFYLFFSSYSPTDYQKQAKLSLSSVDTGSVDSIDKITFQNSDYSKVKNIKNSLTIFSHDEILRQGIDKSPEFSKFIPLSPINNLSTFYAYLN